MVAYTKKIREKIYKNPQVRAVVAKSSHKILGIAERLAAAAVRLSFAICFTFGTFRLITRICKSKWRAGHGQALLESPAQLAARCGAERRVSVCVCGGQWWAERCMLCVIVVATGRCHGASPHNAGGHLLAAHASARALGPGCVSD